jgi:hypothetical protein
LQPYVRNLECTEKMTVLIKQVVTAKSLPKFSLPFKRLAMEVLKPAKATFMALISQSRQSSRNKCLQETTPPKAHPEDNLLEVQMRWTATTHVMSTANTLAQDITLPLLLVITKDHHLKISISNNNTCINYCLHSNSNSNNTLTTTKGKALTSLPPPTTK